MHINSFGCDKTPNKVGIIVISIILGSGQKTGCGIVSRIVLSVQLKNKSMYEDTKIWCEGEWCVEVGR